MLQLAMLSPFLFLLGVGVYNGLNERDWQLKRRELLELSDMAVEVSMEVLDD